MIAPSWKLLATCAGGLLAGGFSAAVYLHSTYARASDVEKHDVRIQTVEQKTAATEAVMQRVEKNTSETKDEMKALRERLETYPIERHGFQVR